MKYATGGVLVPADGKPHTITIERIGQCIHGFCLYSIDGDPQHIASSRDVASGDTRRLTCPCGGKVATK